MAKSQSGKVMESKKVSNAHLKQVNSRHEECTIMHCKQGPAAWQTANQSDLMLRIDADRIVIIVLHISIKLCAA